MSLTQIACNQVILQAARIYASDLEPSVNYSSFLVIGADEVLCLPDEITPASAKQRIQWQKYQWIRWASSPKDLTLMGCIRWLMIQSSEDDEDCVTLDQVREVLEADALREQGIRNRERARTIAMVDHAEARDRHRDHSRDDD